MEIRKGTKMNAKSLGMFIHQRLRVRLQWPMRWLIGDSHLTQCRKKKVNERVLLELTKNGVFQIIDMRQRDLVIRNFQFVIDPLPIKCPLPSTANLIPTKASPERRIKVRKANESQSE